MSANALLAVLVISGLCVAGVIVMTDNMDKLRYEDNAFAKDCNDRGGVAKFEYSVRQCIGAQMAEPAHNEKGDGNE